MLLHMNGKFPMVKLQVIEINCFYTIEKDNLKTNSSIYIFLYKKWHIWTMTFSSSVHNLSRILMDTTVVYVITSPCVVTSIREIRHNIVCTGIFHFVIWGRIFITAN